MKLKALFLLMLGVATMNGQAKKTTAAKKPAATTSAAASEGIFAEMETSKGKILLQLEYKATPVTVANFVSLAEGTNPQVSAQYKGKKFYDGLKFHRVIKDFMIQGGDPLGSGQGDPGYKFKDEITDAKFDKAGILAMANAGPGTNGSQFFITHKDTPWLNGKHTIFGYVITGQDVVNAIAQDDQILKVTIIRKGADAKKFDAAKVFGDYFANKSVEEKAKMEADAAAKKVADEKLAAAAAVKKPYLDKQKAAGTATPSGVVFTVIKGGGAKPADGTVVNLYYAGYLENGTLFDSNIIDVSKEYGKFDQRRLDGHGYDPIPFTIGSQGKMIAGFTEALSHMGFNDKIIAFLPASQAYGERGAGGVIPPNANIIFEIEMLEKKP
ncbi:peptidylprolyl isomerase [Flavobacterium silvaticum]|uniref:peptidylprolyl isomerase n=1 Tax=Flavobacterium silvaticum TaxID=1852020 RepID=A0A972FMD2_9FLAO|nr:peptidylprolyl isomerase [Flavobacterium silvaticum]NMH27865.1 peptidylprolyl isomerase [Flavobacterium silvaticum]